MTPFTTYIANISGGKDSVAMSLRLAVEGWKGEAVSEYIFADTSKEYPETYEAISRFEKLTGKVVTRLKAKHQFEYYLAEVPTKLNRRFGYGFPSMRLRWCTSMLKKDLIRNYLAGRNAVQLIGIASDETKRIRNEKGKEYPLVAWGEADCLAYCKANGFYTNANNPYQYISRVSCYCCPLCNQAQISYLIRHRPELWRDIKHLEQISGERWKRGTDYYERKFAVPELGF